MMTTTVWWQWHRQQYEQVVGCEGAAEVEEKGSQSQLLAPVKSSSPPLSTSLLLSSSLLPSSSTPLSSSSLSPCHNCGRCLMSSNTEVAGRPQWLVGFEGEPVTKGSSLEDHHRLHYQTIITTSILIFFFTIETIAISKAGLLCNGLGSFFLEYNVYLLLVAVRELS